MNDYVNSDGTIRAEKAAKATEEGSDLLRFLNLLSLVQFKFLVIGGSSKVWNVSDD
jgi:hypothetical protein